MQITRLRLHNICQFANFETTFSPGLIALCGRNGSGKTTLIRSLVYGLTGLVDGSWGTQQNMQKDGTIDAGFVEVDIADGADAVYTIRRYSTSGVKFPDSVSRTSGDGPPQRVAIRRRDVDVYLQQLYGISCQLLFQICWGRQARMDALLTAPPALVNSSLSSIFDMRYVESIREKLKLQLDTVAHFSLSCLAEEQSTRQQLAATAEKLSAAQAEAEERVQLLAAATEVYNAASAKVSGAPTVKELSDAAGALREASQRLSQIPAEMHHMKPEHPKDALLQRQTQQTEKLKELQASAADIAAKAAVADQSLSSAQSYLRTVETGADELIRKAEVCDRSCALCDSPVTDAVSYQRHKWLLLTGKPGKQEYLESQHKLTQAVDIEQLTKNKQALTTELDSVCADIKEQAKELKTIESLLDCWQSYEAQERKCTERAAVERECSVQRTNYNALLARKCSDEDYDNFQQAKKLLTTAQSANSQAERAVASLEAAKKLLTEQLQKAQKTVSQYKTNMQVREVLQQLRDALSPQRAQAIYLAAEIDRLNGRFQQLLDIAEMPFSLFLNKETHLFEYATADGFVHPASHLSGAQKNIAAVILQMAIFETLAPRLNIFFVDEPTEALDPENTAIMAQLLQKMSRMLPSIDGVMLLATRDEQLIDSCENTINVSEVT